MGLDRVELIMAIEEHFDLKLSNAEAQKPRTVRELAGVVAAKLSLMSTGPHRDKSNCPTAARFYDLRRRMCEALRIERSAVRPSTSLHTLDLTRKQSDAVSALRRAGIAFPEFVPPPGRTKFAERTSAIAAIMVAAAGCAALWNPVASVGSTWLFVLVGCMMLPVGGVIFSVVHERFCTHLAATCGTVGDLVTLDDPALVPLRTESREALERTVLQRIRILTAQQMGMHQSEISADTRFVEDLGF